MKKIIFITALVLLSILIVSLFLNKYFHRNNIARTPQPQQAQKIANNLVVNNFKISNLPSDVFPEQIQAAYQIKKNLYALAFENNMNFYFTELDGKIIEWHGVLRSSDNGKTWVKFWDLLSQAKSDGGLGLGPTTTSIIFLAAILVLVVFLTISKKDVTPQEKVLADA